MSSPAAVSVNALEVSSLSKVTLVGAPDQSPAVAPSWPVAVIGISTVRSGTALSVTVTTAWSSLAAVAASSLSATL